MKKFYIFIKKIILSGFLIYGYNIVIFNFSNIIPLNIYTIGAVSYFGVPMLFILIFIKNIYL